MSWTVAEEKQLIGLVNKKLSNREIAKLLSKTVHGVDSKLKRIKGSYKVKARRASPDKANYVINKSLLTTVGLTLYWSEGSKQPNRIVEFVNADPHTIKIFMKFLKSLDIDPKRLRGRVKIYDFQNISECQKYWSVVSGIPESQFQKPIIRKNKPSRIRESSKGTLTVRYNSLKLFIDLQSAVTDLKIALSSK